jgi:hypothetical protein
VTRTLTALSILYSITRDRRPAKRCKTFHSLCSRIVTSRQLSATARCRLHAYFHSAKLRSHSGSQALNNLRVMERWVMPENQSGLSVLLRLVWTLAGLLLAAAAGYHLLGQIRESRMAFTTPYQAVLLANGAVYFGHLQGYGSGHPLLMDAYYIVTQTNPETKQSTNVLVKRGKELHEPDRMYLTPSQITLVEPVGENSKVAHLIEQAGKQ